MNVLTQKDLQNLLSAAAAQTALGCNSIECNADTAKALKADFVMRLAVSIIEGKTVLAGVMLSPDEARVLRRELVRLPPNVPAVRGVPLLARQLFPPFSEDGAAPAASDGEIQAESNDQPMVSGSVLVMLSRDKTNLLDEAGYGAVERMAAEALTGLNGVTVISNEEARDLVMQEANATSMGQESSGVLAKVGAALKADYVVGLTIGDLGGAAAITGSLIHVEGAEVLARGSLTLMDATNVGPAAQVVALQLLGIHKELPPSPAQADRFDVKVKALAEQVLRAYNGSGPSALSRLAVLPFADVAPEAKANNLGQEAGGFVQREVAAALAKQSVAASKVEELLGVKTKNLGAWTDADFKEGARFLGASHVVSGEVKKMGNDFLLRAYLYNDMTGEKTDAGHVFFPMGDPSKLITKAFVVRTKEEAIIRSLVPGFGQFYNGPKHRTKGYVVLGGTLLGLAGAGYTAYTGSQIGKEALLYDPNWQSNGAFPQETVSEMVAEINSSDASTPEEIAALDKEIGDKYGLPFLSKAARQRARGHETLPRQGRRD